MCILSLSLDVGPRWAVVLIANRDERHARASAPLAAWPDDPDIRAGRDLVSGGAWLGVSSHGLAAVTNLRGAGPPDPTAPSRGRLVSDVLKGLATDDDLARYNPFNLVTVSEGGARILTNRPVRATALGAGIHGLSNGPVGEASAKTAELNAALAQWLDGPGDAFDPLFDALRSERAAEPGAPGAGVFVRHPDYGTRCSTVAAVGRDGSGVIEEQLYDADAAPAGRARLTFRWPGF